jgi:eukaryotic-like serine/threonine-protein kinase
MRRGRDSLKSSLGQDVSRDADRRKWRAQAREWLRADLAAWGKALDSDPTAARADVRHRLTQWRADPDLAGLREPPELEKLSAGKGKTTSRFGLR